MTDLATPTRINDSLLLPLERRACRWLSERLPAWVTPDRCTAAGVLGAFMAFAGYVSSHRDARFLWLASAGLVLNWFGDSLDGALARQRGIERPRFGFFIDHTTDALCQVVVLIGLGLSPYVRLDVACLALVGYLLIESLALVGACVLGEFRMSYGRLGATEMRALAVLLNLAMYRFGTQPLASPIAGMDSRWGAYDLVVAAVAGGMLGAFVSTAWGQARRLLRLGE